MIGSICAKSTVAACAGSTAGNIYANNTTVQAADLAEHMPTADTTLVPGDVVVIGSASSGDSADFQKSTHANQANAMGVVSTSPGVTLGTDTKSSRPIALAGRVPVNVTLEGGAIAIGDYLVASYSHQADVPQAVLPPQKAHALFYPRYSVIGKAVSLAVSKFRHESNQMADILGHRIGGGFNFDKSQRCTRAIDDQVNFGAIFRPEVGEPIVSAQVIIETNALGNDKVFERNPIGSRFWDQMLT